MKYSNRGFWYKLTSSKLMLFFFIFLFLFLIKVSWNIREKSIISSTKLNVAENELIRLNEHQKDLQEQINNLSTESGVENEIRTKYKAIKDGELVAVIVDNDQMANVVDSSSTDILNNKNISWFKKILKFFGF